MRFLIQLLSMVAVALVVGFGLSYYALTDGRLLGALKVGPWAAWPAVGSASPDPYTRAYLARTGALQLGQGEGLAFTAADDSDGHPLDRRTARVAEAEEAGDLVERLAGGVVDGLAEQPVVARGAHLDEHRVSARHE